MDLATAPPQSPKLRRSNGTGTLHVQTRSDGRQLWYGRWYAGSRRRNRRIGLKRRRGKSHGLTKIQAEEELRRMMVLDRPLEIGEVPTFAAAVELMLRELEEIGRKPTTLANYRTILGVRLLPRFGEIPVDRVRPAQVEALAAQMIREGISAHTRANTLKLLSQVFNYSLRRRWCRENPCLGVRRPRIQPSSDIRFLDKDELEALVKAIDIEERPFGAVDRAIVLTAAMTGMRQGELLALRWLDVDWRAQRIRVRRNYVRGFMGTPKSRSGERSVPLCSRVAAELTELRDRSRFCGDEDLVFASPLSGGALDHASLLRRFKKALKAASMRPVRFGTHSVQEWPPHPTWRCARSRSGWATATTERPSSTPTTNRARTRAQWWMRPSRRTSVDRGQRSLSLNVFCDSVGGWIPKSAG